MKIDKRKVVSRMTGDKAALCLLFSTPRNRKDAGEEVRWQFQIYQTSQTGNIQLFSQKFALVQISINSLLKSCIKAGTQRLFHSKISCKTKQTKKKSHTVNLHLETNLPWKADWLNDLITAFCNFYDSDLWNVCFMFKGVEKKTSLWCIASCTLRVNTIQTGWHEFARPKA